MYNIIIIYVEKQKAIASYATTRNHGNFLQMYIIILYMVSSMLYVLSCVYYVCLNTCPLACRYVSGEGESENVYLVRLNLVNLLSPSLPLQPPSPPLPVGLFHPAHNCQLQQEQRKTYCPVFFRHTLTTPQGLKFLGPPPLLHSPG